MHMPALRVHPKFLVSRSLGGVLLLLAAVGVAAGSAVLVSGMAASILEDGRVWRTGTVAKHAEVQGTQTTSHFIFRSYELQVSFADASGEVRSAKASYGLLFGSLDVDAPLEVRFDPSAPERVALSWAQQALVPRWLQVLFVGAIMVLGFGGFLGWAGLKALRRFRDVRAAAARPEVQLLGVLSETAVIVNGKPTGATRIEWASEGEVGTFVLEKDEQLAALTPDTLVALRTPGAPGRPVVLHGNGYPFVLTEHELSALCSPVVATASASTAGSQVA